MTETETPIAAEREQPGYQRCDQCSAPVEKRQRYCVACGSRQGRAEDPVAQFLAVATSRSRAAKAARPSPGRRRRAPGLGTAAVIAAIPLAVAVGVSVGRANSGSDAKLNAVIAALRAQKPVVVVSGGGATTGGAPAGVATTVVASTFSLQQGYAVELQTLPTQSAAAAAVANAERAARAKGATAVGVINQKAFTVSPKPSGSAYILYSGQFKTKPEAEAALAKLKRRFPGALVIAVRSTASASASSTGAGQIHVSATKAQLTQGAQAVKQISHATGSTYVQDQNNLPGQVSIP